MQAALDLWNQDLQATGGSSVPEKSFWYSIKLLLVQWEMELHELQNTARSAAHD